MSNFYCMDIIFGVILEAGTLIEDHLIKELYTDFKDAVNKCVKIAKVYRPNNMVHFTILLLKYGKRIIRLKDGKIIE